MSEDGDGLPYSVRYLDGHKETSTWLNRAGLAIVQYPNGDTYEGEFNVDLKKHGRGTYTGKVRVEDTAEMTLEQAKDASLVSVYTGDYNNGSREGLGRITYPGGNFYFGTWKYNKRNGAGRFVYSNGDIFWGTWKDDKKEGPGKYIFKSSDSQLTGEWKEDKLSEGTWLFNDGSFYRGGFLNNKPDGPGLHVFANGCEQEGEYVPVIPPGEEDVELDEDAPPYPRAWRGGELRLRKIPPKSVPPPPVEPRFVALRDALQQMRKHKTLPHECVVTVELAGFLLGVPPTPDPKSLAGVTRYMATLDLLSGQFAAQHLVRVLERQESNAALHGSCNWDHAHDLRGDLMPLLFCYQPAEGGVASLSERLLLDATSSALPGLGSSLALLLRVCLDNVGVTLGSPEIATAVQLKCKAAVGVLATLLFAPRSGPEREKARQTAVDGLAELLATDFNDAQLYWSIGLAFKGVDRSCQQQAMRKSLQLEDNPERAVVMANSMW